MKAVLADMRATANAHAQWASSLEATASEASTSAYLAALIRHWLTALESQPAADAVARTAGSDPEPTPRAAEASCNEWRLDDLGLLDDVAVNDVAWFRMERMSPDYVWGKITRRDGSSRMFHLRARLLSWTHDPEEPAKPSMLPAVSAASPGTLDPRSQIADHPNVKFAQLERLKWLKRADAVSTPDGPLHICQQPGFDPRLHRCRGCHP